MSLTSRRALSHRKKDVRVTRLGLPNGNIPMTAVVWRAFIQISLRSAYETSVLDPALQRPPLGL